MRERNAHRSFVKAVLGTMKYLEFAKWYLSWRRIKVSFSFFLFVLFYFWAKKGALRKKKVKGNAQEFE